MATRKDSQKLQILPVGASEFLRKRAMELAGLFFVALGVVMALSLLSFNPEDPGVNRAVDTPAVNMLGTEGALFSSFMLQTFGLGSLFLVLTPLGWGWRSIRDHSFRGWWSYLLTMPRCSGRSCLCITSGLARLDWTRSNRKSRRNPRPSDRQKSGTHPCHSCLGDLPRSPASRLPDLRVQFRRFQKRVGQYAAQAFRRTG